MIVCGAVQESDRGGTAESIEIHNWSGHHDDRNRITCRIHDVPYQACPFLFLLLQTDVGVPFFTLWFLYFLCSKNIFWVKKKKNQNSTYDS
jgi:hypothetical protein